MVTSLLQYVARFHGESDITGWGGYKESRSWCPCLSDSGAIFVAPSGEQLAMSMCWRGTSLSTTSRVFVPIFFMSRAFQLISREWSSGREPS